MVYKQLDDVSVYVASKPEPLKNAIESQIGISEIG